MRRLRVKSMENNLQSTQSIENLTAEIKILKQQTAINIIEIGRRLIQAKKMLPHGEWGKWLEEKVDMSYRSAARFIQVANEFSDMPTLADLTPSKVFALLDLPSDQREEFIESNPIQDMTTRELQAAIKAQKEAERKAKELEQQLEEIQRNPKVLEKTVFPKDYHSLKSKVEQLNSDLEAINTKAKHLAEDKELLERRARLNEKEAKEYSDFKKQIELLKKEKSDISRQIEAATELSGLVVRVEHLLKTELAPIRYSRAIEEQRHDEIVVRNLGDIVGRMQRWCDEMRDLLEEKNYIEVEVK